MHVLHIMAGRGLGGAETYSTDVMMGLQQTGLSQTIVMSRRAPRFETMQKSGLKIAPFVLDVPLRFWQRFRLRALIQREKPDIVHCWMRRAASLMPRRADTAWHRAVADLPDPETTFSPDAVCEEASPINYLPRAVIGWFGGYYVPSKFRACTHFVGVTPDIVRHMAENGVDPTRAAFIPTFPDISDATKIDRKSLDTPENAKVLLTLSRLHPKKGLDTFLRALADMPGVYGWLAGDGPIHRQLDALAKSLGLSDRVRFLGWRTDRASLLASADVCVLPSRHEPFGTVTLEAWAANIPLVACMSAGPAATIKDNETGLLVPIDNVSALTQAMQRAINDQSLRRKLIEQGHAAYLKSYTREAVIKQWLSYYQNLATWQKFSPP
ncbi:MAG: glycosyltransferase [Bdellovibrionales bacterium]